MDVGTVIGVGNAGGVGVTEEVGAGIGVGTSNRTNLTMTVWAAFIAIFAVRPDTL